MTPTNGDPALRSRHGSVRADLTDAAVLLTRQDGVVARRQLLELGARQHDLVRWRRRRELVAVRFRVSTSTTPAAAPLRSAPGQPCSRAAPARALWCVGPRSRPTRPWRLQRGRDGPIQVAVPASRHPEPTTRRGRPSRCEGYDQRVLWGLHQPRQRYDDAVIDVATGRRRRPLDAVGVLCWTPLASRRTTAQRLLDACAARPRLRHVTGSWPCCSDIARVDACSVLEHGYLTQVERPHGLPIARPTGAGGRSR